MAKLCRKEERWTGNTGFIGIGIVFWLIILIPSDFVVWRSASLQVPKEEFGY